MQKANTSNRKPEARTRQEGKAVRPEVAIGGVLSLPSSPLPSLPFWQPEPGDAERFIRYCRTEKCPDFQAGHCELHKPMQCFHFHFEGQRRRPPIGEDQRLRYWELPCKWISQPNKCPLGDRCTLAHSKGEISYHPAKYKTRVCNGADCQKATCCFAHLDKELRTKASARYSQTQGTPFPAAPANATGVATPAPPNEPKNSSYSSYQLEAAEAVEAAEAFEGPEKVSEGPNVDLNTFKVFPCRKGRGVHDRKLCPFFHNPRDRRRPPGTYLPEPCDECFDSMADSREGSGTGSSRSCSRGDACHLCHNRLELLYHDTVFKRRFCATFPEVSSCQRGKLCAFAHSREEVRVELLKPEEEELMARWNSKALLDTEIRLMQPRVVEFFTKRFKTLWCPYGTQHGWHECLYAHTDQDWRRRPELGYSSEPCTEWAKHLGERLQYTERCSKGLRCCFAHGSKEQLYHPAYYKTMPCTDWAAEGRCPRGSQCAFYHGLHEQRRELCEATSPSRTVQSQASLPQSSGAGLGLEGLGRWAQKRKEVFSVQDLEAALAQSVHEATRLDPASMAASSVDGATTLSGRSGMRTSFGSLASLASLASSNSGSPAVGPLADAPHVRHVVNTELEPAYVRLPPMWENHGHLNPFPEDDEAATTRSFRL
ncbi:UNK [Symbiodinium pilosum]|uniref:UNK protein n=1 Tax=Symbiodinium pilosum TaxID=2952 RepID=A0A812WF07_SYMPI|nr:UNK [Symbiodinium pilosum]